MHKLKLKIFFTFTSSKLNSGGILDRISQASSSMICWEDLPPPALCEVQIETIL